MRIPALIFAAGLMLSACAPNARQAAQPTAPSAEGLAAACAAKGGSILPVGKAQIPTCVTPYADGGNSCTDTSQCEGACILEGNLEPRDTVTGQCQKTDRQFGCYAKVVNGKSTGAICVD